jgi:hypothetical protein
VLILGKSPSEGYWLAHHILHELNRSINWKVETPLTLYKFGSLFGLETRKVTADLDNGCIAQQYNVERLGLSGALGCGDLNEDVFTTFGDEKPH